MEELNQIDFNINLNDLPASVEELRKKLNPEERKYLEEVTELASGFTFCEDDPILLIRKMYGKEDNPSLSLTHSELIDRIFNSPWFLKSLKEIQKKTIGQFLSTIKPNNNKYYTRDELIITAKNLILTVSE